jgi:DNA-3-methyladenine glycosylase I
MDQGVAMANKSARIVRCAWCEGDALLRDYHDAEWGVPVRDSRLLWETLMLEGFQAGLAWIIVLRKREAFRKAFAQFDPTKVARFGDADIDRLMANEGIIRAKAKIQATIAGAQIFVEMAQRGESFSDLCWSYTHGKTLRGDGKHVAASTALSESISKDLKKRGFKFVGPTIVYAWMQAVGIVNDHALGCYRRAQVARAA